MFTRMQATLKQPNICHDLGFVMPRRITLQVRPSLGGARHTGFMPEPQLKVFFAQPNAWNQFILALWCKCINHLHFFSDSFGSCENMQIHLHNIQLQYINSINICNIHLLRLHQVR